jgi:hypothetical protein
MTGARPCRDYFTRRFMAEDLRIRCLDIADAPFGIPVQIAATDPDSPDAHQDFARSGLAQSRSLAQLESARSDKLDAFHASRRVV